MTRSTTLLVLVAFLFLPQCRRERKPADAPAASSSGVVTVATPPKSAPSALPSTSTQAALSAPPACRDVLLTGSIGANPIVMELRICSKTVGGRYYYRRSSKSLMLFGSIKGDPNTVRRTLELREFGAGDQPFEPSKPLSLAMSRSTIA